MRFRTLLSLAFVLLLFATGIAVIVTMYVNAVRRSSETGEALLASVTARAAQQVRTQSEGAVQVAHSLKGLSEETLALGDSDKLVQQLSPILRANPGISWISFSDPAGNFSGVYRDDAGVICSNQSRIQDGKTILNEHVLHEDGRKTFLRNDPDSKYDPRTRDFYIAAAKQADVVWQPPYVFYGQRQTPGITCALAIRTPANDLRGVLSVDYDLNALSSFVRRIATSPRSRLMVFTADKVLLAHSSAEVVAVSSVENAGKLLTLEDVSEPATKAFRSNLQSTTLAGTGSQPRFIRFAHEGEQYLGCVLPIELASGPRNFVATLAPLHDFAPTPWQFSGGAILVVGAAMLVAAIVAMLLSFGVTRPITTLVGLSERIGKGELDVKIHLGPLREFRRLAGAFELMLANLRDWMRVRTSLQLAMEIQRNLLPAAPPTVPGFDIAGYSCYCDETGGDYYDYILVDRAKPNRLLVALGDVMGHGLPSALLMAGARGILRSAVSSSILPGALLSRLNTLLYQDTSGNRFMTMLLVAFDAEKSSCTWSSAGHDPPIIFDPRTQAFDEPEGGDVPLGITDDVEYGNFQYDSLSVGQTVFIGSDGVWETFNTEGEAYGKERVKAVLAANAMRSADDIKAALLASLLKFRGTAPTKDDVTFVLIKIAALPSKIPANDSFME